ncbi:MAG: hypothetical protein ABSH20_23595 [Tepidisphaeraceae bacterium]|jgi:hypothetical protein
MNKTLGRAILTASAGGYPLTQLVIGRFGRRGAIVAEAVCVGLLVRDSAMIMSGAPGRLRRLPAALLWLEWALAAAAVVAGLPAAVDVAAAARAQQHKPVGIEAVRRGALGALFGLHTVRFAIYLSPDRGRRPNQLT